MAFSKTNRLNMRRVPSGVSEYVGVGNIWDTLRSIGNTGRVPVHRRADGTMGEYVGVGGVWDVISGIGKGALNIYNTGEQAQGAVQAQNALLQADMARANQSDNTLLIVGGLAAAGLLYFMLKKK